MSGERRVRVRPAPQDCALLLVDLQVAAVGSVRTMAPERLRDAAVALASLANLHEMPAVLTAGRKPGVGGVFLPELTALLPGAAFVERTRAAAFDDPHLRDAVAATGRKTLIVAGVATDIGVLFAALGALDAGYEVWVAIDACAAVDAAAEDVARARMAREGAVLTGWASLTVGLMDDFEGPRSLRTLALIAARAPSAASPF